MSFSIDNVFSSDDSILKPLITLHLYGNSIFDGKYVWVTTGTYLIAYEYFGASDDPETIDLSNLEIKSYDNASLYQKLRPVVVLVIGTTTVTKYTIKPSFTDFTYPSPETLAAGDYSTGYTNGKTVTIEKDANNWQNIYKQTTTRTDFYGALNAASKPVVIGGKLYVPSNLNFSIVFVINLSSMELETVIPMFSNVFTGDVKTASSYIPTMGTVNYLDISSFGSLLYNYLFDNSSQALLGPIHAVTKNFDINTISASFDLTVGDGSYVIHADSSMALGTKFLLTAQTNPAENGVYTFSRYADGLYYLAPYTGGPDQIKRDLRTSGTMNRPRMVVCYEGTGTLNGTYFTMWVRTDSLTSSSAIYEPFLLDYDFDVVDNIYGTLVRDNDIVLIQNDLYRIKRTRYQVAFPIVWSTSNFTLEKIDTDNGSSVFITGGNYFNKAFTKTNGVFSAVSSLTFDTSKTCSSNLCSYGPLLIGVSSKIDDVTNQKVCYVNTETYETGQIDLPVKSSSVRSSIANGRDGHIYLTNYNNLGVSKVNMETKSFVSSFRINSSPTQIYIGENKKIYVLSYAGMLNEIDSSGNILSTHSLQDSASKELSICDSLGSNYLFYNLNNTLCISNLLDNTVLESGTGNDWNFSGTLGSGDTITNNVFSFTITRGLTYFNAAGQSIYVEPHVFISRSGSTFNAAAFKLDENTLYREVSYEINGHAAVAGGPYNFFGD